MWSQMTRFHSFYGRITFHHLYNYLLHPFIYHEHVGCFHILAFVNNAAVNIVVIVQLLSYSNSASPRTVAHQAPLSMGFPRQEYWSGLPFPSPGDGSSLLKDQTCVSYICCNGRQVLYHWASWEAMNMNHQSITLDRTHLMDCHLFPQVWTWTKSPPLGSCSVSKTQLDNLVCPLSPSIILWRPLTYLLLSLFP